MTPSRSALTNTVVLFVALLNISVSAIAETVYIRDAIYVPLRGGQ
ncbi:MAG: hypothetical protein ACJAR0_004089, partial [Candidatus Azotimanducaceae bacterium]